MNHKRNSDGIISYSKEKHDKSMKAADNAIRRLLFDKQAVNFNTVAKAAGVSKTFLYSNEDLRKRIEDLRHIQAQITEPKHLKQRMSDTNKDALLQNRVGHSTLAINVFSIWHYTKKPKIQWYFYKLLHAISIFYS